MDPRPTLADVAARAGVSKSLVSLVMRGEPGASADTRRRVLEAADQLGYHPDSRARLLRSGRSRLLGVVFGIEHTFHADLVTALYTAARETGYELALSAVTPDRDEAEATAGLLQDRCEALILIGPHRPAAHLARLAARLPVVVLARTVRAIDARASRDAARNPPPALRRVPGDEALSPPSAEAAARHDGAPSSPPAEAAAQRDRALGPPPAEAAARHDGAPSSPPAEAAAQRDRALGPPSAEAAARHDGAPSSPPAEAAARHDGALGPPWVEAGAPRDAALGSPPAEAGAGRSRPVDVVRTADAEGLRRAVDHLVDLGHRRIAHIDGGRAPGATERRRGYRDAMRRHGLVPHIRIIPGGLTEAEGAAAARALLGGEPPGNDAARDGRRSVPADVGDRTADVGGRPTAVVVFNDRCATGVLDVFARRGLRVPADISVVGYDDSHLARLAHIDLTTVAQDAATMSRLAVARAIDRIEGVDVPHRDAVVPPRLVVRGTTGPPAG